jgi:hypothetical protein
MAAHMHAHQALGEAQYLDVFGWPPLAASSDCLLLLLLLQCDHGESSLRGVGLVAACC